MTSESFFKFKNVPPIISHQSRIIRFGDILPWRWVTARRLVEEALICHASLHACCSLKTSRMNTFWLQGKSEIWRFTTGQIQWSCQKGSYTHNERLTSWSTFHPNWEKKKKNSLWRSLQMLLWKDSHNKRERAGKKKKERAWKGYFFKQLQLSSQIIWYTRRQWI